MQTLINKLILLGVLILSLGLFSTPNTNFLAASNSSQLGASNKTGTTTISTNLKSSTTTRINWNGKGATNGKLDTIQCTGDTPPGTMLWIFTLGGNNNSVLNPQLYVGGILQPAGTKFGSEYHFYTPYFDLSTLNSTNTYVLFAGSTGSGTANLVISHGCPYQLQISKTANTSLTRTWSWQISKSADQTDLGTLQPTDIKTVNYTATVSASSLDSNLTVGGTITITNPSGNPDATITGVSDVLNSFGNVINVDCGITFPHTLATNSTLHCTYSAVVSNQTDSQNTATVTTTGLVAGSTTNVPVDWSNPTINKVDDCITVTDTNPKGPHGVQVCSTDLVNGKYEFNYSVTFSKEGIADYQLSCGSNTYKNTISFVTNTNSTTGSADWTVIANVNCVGAFWCSPGFWSNGAKFDIYAYLSANKVINPPATVSGSDPYSSITGVTAASLSTGDPNTVTLSNVLNSPNIYGGPAFNSVADYFAYLLGWSGTQQTTPEFCPLDAHGNLIIPTP